MSSDQAASPSLKATHGAFALYARGLNWCQGKGAQAASSAPSPLESRNNHGVGRQLLLELQRLFPLAATHREGVNSHLMGITLGAKHSNTGSLTPHNILLTWMAYPHFTDLVK